MDLSGIKNFVSDHPWEATGIGGGLAVLFFVVYRHASGSAPVPAIAALSPSQQLAAARIAGHTQIAMAHQQELAATLPARYAATAQTRQAGIAARMQELAAQISEKLGLANIRATLKMTPTGTQQTGLAYQGLATKFADAQLAAEVAMTDAPYGGGGYNPGMGYGGNAGYGFYASPYYTPAYQNPAAYLGSGGVGGFLNSIGNLFGGGGGGGAADLSSIDYGGGGP